MMRAKERKIARGQSGIFHAAQIAHKLAVIVGLTLIAIKRIVRTKDIACACRPMNFQRFEDAALHMGLIIGIERVVNERLPLLIAPAP